MRGVAAMMVAAGHSLVLIDMERWQELLARSLQLVLNGRAAVSVFFVLSGLVLGMALRRGRGTFGQIYASFAIRRWLRIVPAMVVGLSGIVAVLALWQHPQAHLAASKWYHLFFHAYDHPPTVHQVWRNVTLMDVSLNEVAWTLRIELVCSLLLPLLHWIAQRQSPGRNLLLLAFLIGLCPFAPPRDSQGIWLLLANNGEFLFMFFLGYLLLDLGPWCFGWLKPRRWLSLLILVAALGTLFLCRELKGAWLRPGEILEGLAAATFVGSLMYGRDFRGYALLDLHITRFYGRISYSFYLLHFFCLFVVAQWLFRLVPSEWLHAHALTFGACLWLVSTAVATPLSWLIYQYVETPFIHFSKLICLRWVEGAPVNIWREMCAWLAERRNRTPCGTPVSSNSPG